MCKGAGLTIANVVNVSNVTSLAISSKKIKFANSGYKQMSGWAPRLHFYKDQFILQTFTKINLISRFQIDFER